MAFGMRFGILITSLKIGICAVILAFLVFVYYRYKFYKEIGGITGDTAGWFLQVCELVTAFSILIDN